ncbi:MAG TPA: hypothetical protein VK607_10490 [Kofleriaceae bacterium]|nr:hypothetical protein [Kofleriaceae bacterium]
MKHRSTFRIVTVFYDAERGWACRGADDAVEYANQRERYLDLFMLAEAARLAALADVAELMIDEKLRLAWGGPDRYQWVDDAAEPAVSWSAPGGDA